MTLRIALALILALAGCSGEPRQAGSPAEVDVRPSLMNATPDQVEAGQRIVELKCVSCHAVRSEDKSHNPLAPPLRTLAERYPVTGLEEAFAQGVMVGHPNMPDFRFDREQIKSILAYLESIQTRRGAALDPKNLDVSLNKAPVGAA